MATNEDKAYEVLRRYNRARDEVRRLHATDASKSTIRTAQVERDAIEGLLVKLVEQAFASDVTHAP